MCQVEEGKDMTKTLFPKMFSVLIQRVGVSAYIEGDRKNDTCCSRYSQYCVDVLCIVYILLYVLCIVYIYIYYYMYWILLCIVYNIYIIYIYILYMYYCVVWLLVH